MDNSRLKVVLINHSDARGGAAVVTRRLMNALCAEGVDARMLVVHKDTDSLRIAEASGARRAQIPFLAEHADIFMRNGRRRDTLFRISTGRFGLPLSSHPWVKEADAVILNWVNQGVLSLSEIRKIASIKPVVWTMHDMWNMTGVCHYTDGCANWLSGCGECVLTGRSSLAERVFEAKRRLYTSADIRFVAVSHRLAQLCRQSPLMEGLDITVIPNALPVERFDTRPALSRAQLGLPEGRRLIVTGAARLDDPVKNLQLAISALNRTKATDITAVFYGNMRNPELLDSLDIPHLWLGHIDSHERLQSLMAHASVVLSTSLWETLPGTLVEGIAAGAIAVATDNGGQADIVTQGKTGYLVKTTGDAAADAHSVAEAIDKALALPNDSQSRQERHLSMARRFGAPAVARQYIALLNQANFTGR